jgi:pilus assembly protein Flp/PilA
MRTFKSMILEDDGATMVEYGLLLGLIALVALVAIKDVGRAVDRIFDSARDAIRGSN